MKVLIIDDDSSSHVTLKKLLQESEGNEIQEIQSGYDLATGISLAREWKPDVLFLDIELPDGLGFDLLSQFQ
ncbi:MAG: response regulator, partial [Bacteroidota bacterium]